MPNTGERREITRRVNAKQAETVQQSKKLLSKSRQLFASMEAKNRRTYGESRKQQKGDLAKVRAPI